MIKKDLNPLTKAIDFINPNDKHGRLQITISVYDEPVMSTPDVNIHSIVKIEEDKGEGFTPYGEELCQAELTEDQIEEAFKNIKANPTKFKNK